MVPGCRKRARLLSGILLGYLVSSPLVFAPSVHAATLQYTLDLPDRRDAAFEVSFDVEHVGALDLVANWSGSRIVSFRLEGPGRPALRVHRSGPSPQRLHLEVGEKTLSLGPTWKLFIRALSAQGDSHGLVTLELPGDKPPASVRDEPGPAPPPRPLSKPEAWAAPRETPRASPPSSVRLFQTIEAYRSRVVSPGGELVSDPCAWQPDLLRYLTSKRDRWAEHRARPDDEALRHLGRLAAAVRRVETLRTSRDPLLAGPVPEEPLDKQAWLAERREWTRPLERELDDLLRAARPHDAELETETWPARFIACLTACERHFEERVRLGDDQAVNADLARTEWERFLAAAGALEALSALETEPSSQDAFAREP